MLSGTGERGVVVTVGAPRLLHGRAEAMQRIAANWHTWTQRGERHLLIRDWSMMLMMMMMAATCHQAGAFRPQIYLDGPERCMKRRRGKMV
jgi:hypothetical protein